MRRLTNNDHLPTQIVAAIRDFAPLSRADIARRLAISPSTVTRLVDRLIQDGVVLEEGKHQERQTGRPATILQINPDIAGVIAIDLRLTEAYMALANLDGKVITRTAEPLPSGDAAGSIRQLLTLIQLHREAAPACLPVRAVVIGAPSLVDPETGLVEWAPSFGWKGLPLGQILSDSLHLPVRVENDVNLAALGEFWKGAAQGARNAVFVSVGSGIGAGIILQGELYNGTTNAAGEVGYFITDLDILRDQAGKIGHLEQRVGRAGTLRRARLVAQRYPTSRLADLIQNASTNLRAQDVFGLAMEGDPAAAVVLNETVDLLTIVVTNLSVVLDPQIIVLGGPSDWRWEILVEAIKKRVGASLLRPIHLTSSTLGRDAVIQGAAYAALRLDGVLPDSL